MLSDDRIHVLLIGLHRQLPLVPLLQSGTDNTAVALQNGVCECFPFNVVCECLTLCVYVCVCAHVCDSRSAHVCAHVACGPANDGRTIQQGQGFIHTIVGRPSGVTACVTCSNFSMLLVLGKRDA